MLFTREHIDELVLNDAPIVQSDALKSLTLSDIPGFVSGGWALRVIGNTDDNNFTARVVAVPTNKRAGTIFKVGKLRAMERTYPHIESEILKKYTWSSRGLKWVWEKDTQDCALMLYEQLGDEELDALLKHSYPRDHARALGYYISITRARFSTALELVRRMRDRD